MEGYLGQEIVKQEDTEFKDFTKSDWCLYFIETYGQIDGAHHKAWVLDQCARILNNSNIIIKKATWKNGNSEWRISVEDGSDQYHNWAFSMLGEYGQYGREEFEYSYDCGVAP